MTVEELLEFAAASPIRPHVRQICVLSDYDGPVAYYDRGLVISGELWEAVRSDAVGRCALREHTGASQITGIPVLHVLPGEEVYLRMHGAKALGLFGRVTLGGTPPAALNETEEG